MQARTFMAFAMVLLVIAALTASARAEIRIAGSASSVRVEARDATVADVLAALAQRFAVRVRGTTGDRRVSADFDGPLRRVIAQVLKGYDFVILARGDGLEVMVLGVASSNAEAPPVYRVPTYPAARLRRDE